MIRLPQKLNEVWLVIKILLLTMLALIVIGSVVMGIVWLIPIVLTVLVGVGVFILLWVLFSPVEDKEEGDTD